MGGAEAIGKKKKKPEVFVPDTGAAKYWYVDPRSVGAQAPANGDPFDPMAFFDEQGHSAADIEAALRRIGVSDNQTPSF